MNKDSGFLCVSGMDAKRFLQGQLTCHLDEVTLTQSCLGAHCNPQGRVISFFRLFYSEDQYFLQMPDALVPIAMKALKKYAVFFKVELHPLKTPDQLPFEPLFPTKLTDFAMGIPTIYPETSELFLPHEINLHTIKAISFHKGCYTGQEIIARMHYRGKLKTELFQGTVENISIAPVRGADVYDESQQPVGRIVDYYLMIPNQSKSNKYLLLLSAKTNCSLFFNRDGLNITVVSSI